MDWYFIRYPLSEIEKVRLAITKLAGQASQYWTDVMKKRVLCGQEPINTWSYMNDELKAKYVAPFYFADLLDNWH